jgi:hypothetical protein
MENLSHNYIINDDEYLSSDVSLVGGKAVGFGELISLGQPIPNSFCISTKALSRFLTFNHINDLFPKTIKNEFDLVEYSDKISNLIMKGKFPEDLIFAIEKVLSTYSNLKIDCSIMTRSSHFAEDTLNALSSGQYLSVKTDRIDIYEAVKKVWASNYTVNAFSYRKSRDLPYLDQGMAVLIHPFIEAKYGGVASTVNPINLDSSNVIIDYILGDPEKILSNTSLSQTLTINKLRSHEASQTIPPFCELLIKELKASEQRLDCPITVEWLITANDELYFLQLKKSAFKRQIYDGFYTTAEDVAFKSPKLNPIRWHYEVENRAPFKAIILTPRCFEEFFKLNREISHELNDALQYVFEYFIKSGSISVRGVYWSDIYSANNQPQSGDINTFSDFKDALITYWNYIFYNQLNDYTSQPAVMISNWLNVVSSAIVYSGRSNLGNPLIYINALFGFPEGFEQNTFDVYEFNPQTMNVDYTYVANKKYFVRRPNLKPEPVLPNFRKLQVISNVTINKIGQLATRLMESMGEIRVEFLITKDQHPIIWQVENFQAKNEHYLIDTAGKSERHTAIQGHYLHVTTKKMLINLQTKNVSGRLILLDLRSEGLRDQNWQTEAINKLSELKSPVIYLGSILSHFCMSAIEAGIPIYPVNSIPDHIQANDEVAIYFDFERN